MTTIDALCMKMAAAQDKAREALAAAWLAETGLQPSESVLHVQRDYTKGLTRIWFEKKADGDPVGKFSADRVAARAERDHLKKLLADVGTCRDIDVKKLRDQIADLTAERDTLKRRDDSIIDSVAAERDRLGADLERSEDARRDLQAERDVAREERDIACEMSTRLRGERDALAEALARAREGNAQMQALFDLAIEERDQLRAVIAGERSAQDLATRRGKVLSSIRAIVQEAP